MTRNEVTVWDPVVRLGHWIVVAAFAIAYVTEDDFLSMHVWAGYLVGLVVALRVLWGFVGTRHARFSDFVYSPTSILSHLNDLVHFRAKRYLGHSPAGGAMVFALLLSLSATVITGLATYGADKNAGPLAPFYAAGLSASPAPTMVLGVHPAVARDAKRREPDETRKEDESGMKELHELLANVTLLLVFLHVAGVGFSSIVHRENLVRAMITGRKQASVALAARMPTGSLNDPPRP